MSIHRTAALAALAAAAFVTAGFALAATGASDNASNPVYADGWQPGDNGGTGFGTWSLGAVGGFSGEFLASANNNGGGGTAAGGLSINTSGQSWGLFANTGNTADAVRPFTGSLLVNQTFSLAMDNGFIDTGGTVGFGLRNSSGQNRIEFYFKGGDSAYTINDASGPHQLSGVGFTDKGLKVTFALTSADAYTLSVTPLGGSTSTFTGTLAGTSGTGVDRTRVFNFNAGNGGQKDAFFNSMAIQNQATISASTTPAFGTIIVGSSTGVSASIGNTAAAGSMNLSYTASAGAGVTGSSQTGTVAPGASTTASGFTFTGTTVGAGQSATITVSDPSATNSPQSATATIDVVGHASASLGTPTRNFGKVIVGTTVADQTTSLANAVGHRAALEILGLGGLSRAGSGTIAAGSSDTLSASVSTATAGVYHQTYAVQTSDDTSIHGATAQSNLTFTVDGQILNHANAVVSPDTSTDPRDSAYDADWHRAGDGHPTKTVSAGGKTIDVDFGAIFATPNDHPYPVYGYVDLGNIGSNLADLVLSSLSFTEVSDPSGTGTWTLTDTGTDATPTAGDFGALGSNQSHTFKVGFDSGDYGLYLPNSPFRATWKMYLTDAADVVGGYHGAADLANWDPNYVITINGSATAVPLPATVVGAIPLLGLVVTGRVRRKQRQ